MTQPDIIQTILKDSNYHLDLFDESEIQALREEILIQTVRGKKTAFIRCPIRRKAIQLKPEELIRQLYAARLLNQYRYPKERVRFEHLVNFGRERKRADIVILDKDRPDTPYIIIEVKKPKLQDGKDQLRSYCNATGAPIAVWTNGQQISHYHRKDPNYFEEITDIPKANQTLANILNERFTLKDLILKDKLAAERKSLKNIILELENEVLANAGVDVFEEVFKLIFTKLYDEFKSQDDKMIINYLLRQSINTAIQETDQDYELAQPDYEMLKKAVEDIPDDGFRSMEFRNTGQTDSELKVKIQRLFDDAKNQWKGVFPEYATFELSESHLSVCVSSLQDVKLFNSNLQIVDEAFEYLVNKSAKGEKGQYFTPRHVIDMCVKMLNPKRGEYMIDTASGSCGFPVHTIFKLTGTLFSNAEIPPEDKEHVLKVFGIDFDEGQSGSPEPSTSSLAMVKPTFYISIRSITNGGATIRKETAGGYALMATVLIGSRHSEPKPRKINFLTSIFSWQIHPLPETSRNAASSTSIPSVLKETVNHKAKSDATFSLLSVTLISSNPVDAWRLSSRKVGSTTHLINTFVTLSRSMRASWQSLACIPTPSNPTPAPKPAFYLCRSGTTIQMMKRISLKLTTTQSFSRPPRKVARITPAITFSSKIAMGNTN